MTETPARRPATSFSFKSYRQRRQSYLTALALAALLLVAACGGSQVDPAPEFAFTLFQGEGFPVGEELNLRDLKGKPVVLNFWAGLCPPCRAEMPDLQAFHDDRNEEVTLVGVDIGQFMGLGSQADAENLLRELEITYPAGYTNDSNIVRAYEVLGMPTTVFINPDGSIFEKWTGALPRKALDETVQEMLDQAG